MARYRWGRRTRSRVVTVAFDTFTRADSAVSLGTAESGQAWSALSGTWGISGNQARIATLSGANTDAAVVDAGVSDCLVTVTMATVGGTPRLVFRATDASNCFFVDVQGASATKMYRRQAGANNEIASTTTLVPNGGILSVRLNGADIRAALNGVELFSVTSAFNQTATKHGLGGTATDARFDDFRVTR